MILSHDKKKDESEFVGAHSDEDIDLLLGRCVVDVIVKDDLAAKLKSGKKLRIKLGIDPTGDKIHLGRTIPLRKLRQFQDKGHQIILIIGDFTGMIGDPSAIPYLEKLPGDIDQHEQVRIAAELALEKLGG